jgi:hypothetical protein
LIVDIAKALVDLPEEVAVREVEGEQVTILELRVAASDLGKVIGKPSRPSLMSLARKDGIMCASSTPYNQPTVFGC